ncbi:MAG: E3 ubiquitin ligase family protein [Spirochaetales bacterium]|nr:E3 ubiquitin ligase family protein [Spirochaetales bacterium]
MGFVIGGILVAAGIGLVFARISQGNKLMQIKGTQTVQTKELQELCADVAKEIGAGSFNQLAEVKGKSTCQTPLTSELAKAACVYFSMRVSREYEETYWDTDSNGHRVQRTRRGSDTVANNTREIPFYIQDDTGTVRVNPERASFVAEKVFSHFEPGEVSGPSLSFGGLTIALSGLGGSAATRTLGYRYEEDIIPIGRDLYVLGEASDSGGELAIQKPTDKKQKFIISVKSEEELVRSATSAMTALLVASAITATGGLAVIVLTAMGILVI